GFIIGISLQSSPSGLFNNLREDQPSVPKLTPEEKREALDQLSTISRVFVEVAAEVKPAVVNISTESSIQSKIPFDTGDPFFDFYFNPNQPRRSQGFGSGFIINKEGFILTNYHVIQNADKIRVRLSDKREFEAKLIGSDEQSDIALIKIEGENLPVARLGDSDRVQVGEWVIAVGSPFSFDFTVTAGIISAIKRSGVTGARYENYIQTDAAINPGNSGGPLVNLNGEVIGINTAIVSRSGGFQGLGFAIPINFVKALIPQLQEHGKVKHGVVGISIQPLDKELARKFGLKENSGVIITEIYKNSPAEQAGLNVGDIILELNSKTVDSVNTFIFEMGMATIGEKVELTVFRNNRKEKITVEVIEMEKILFQDTGKGGDSVSDNDLGITVSNITEGLVKKFNLSSTARGVVVTEIEKNSIVRTAGLRVGSVIVEINRKKINNIDDYKREMTQGDLENGILFLIIDRNITQYTIIQKR
ncbi:MAG TPA: Do family serine endopeptidase, partial [Firmicutes bacterium]|nr:Do family serine endopeptidase [Bacillota bacterium]